MRERGAIDIATRERAVYAFLMSEGLSACNLPKNRLCKCDAGESRGGDEETSTVSHEILLETERSGDS
jgi:hypothetical protein